MHPQVAIFIWEPSLLLGNPGLLPTQHPRVLVVAGKVWRRGQTVYAIFLFRFSSSSYKQMSSTWTPTWLPRVFWKGKAKMFPIILCLPIFSYLEVTRTINPMLACCLVRSAFSPVDAVGGLQNTEQRIHCCLCSAQSKSFTLMRFTSRWMDSQCIPPIYAAFFVKLSVQHPIACLSNWGVKYSNIIKVTSNFPLK